MARKQSAYIEKSGNKPHSSYPFPFVMFDSRRPLSINYIASLRIPMNRPDFPVTYRFSTVHKSYLKEPAHKQEALLTERSTVWRQLVAAVSIELYLGSRTNVGRSFGTWAGLGYLREVDTPGSLSSLRRRCRHRSLLRPRALLRIT